MADKSKIEWTEATWNPVTGCTKVSPGCDHCYAETFAERWRGTPGHHFERGFDLTLRPDRLMQPIRWPKPRRIFVNSMSDLFHDDIPDDFIAQVFAVMLAAQRHVFQVLTKRHGRMRSLLSSDAFVDAVMRAADPLSGRPMGVAWPLPNVWLGVSVETQQWADIRIPALLETPAARRWLSCEPLLGPVDLTYVGKGIDALYNEDDAQHPWINWVVVGGESGHGARPMDPAWVRSIRDQCMTWDTPFFFKQWGEWATVTTPSGEHRERLGKKHAGRTLDGRTWDEFPITSPTHDPSEHQ